MVLDLPPEPTKIWLPPKPAIIRPASQDLIRDCSNAAIIRQAQEDVRRDALARSRRRAQTAVAPATRVYVGSTPSTSDANTYTYTNHAIGTAAVGRLIVVVCMQDDSGTGGSNMALANGTIGGSAATVHTSTASERKGVGIMSRVVDTGTTATIVVNLLNSAGRAAISVYALYDLTSTTPFDAVSSVGNSALTSLAIDVPANGILIAGIAANLNSVSWSGATEDYDAATESRPFSSASEEGLAAETGRSVSGTITSGGWGMAAATWA